MTREEAIRILERKTTIPEDGVTWEQINQAIEMAVSALRAQQDRIQFDGCEYCKGDLEGYTSVIKDWKGPGRMYIPEGEANLVVSGRYSHRACIHIRFCPFCGRPLTEGADAELKKREEADNETD